MNEIERCVICSNLITDTMVVCPHCGSVIHREEFHIDSHNRYNYTVDKNIEYLEKIDLALCHLEEELDAFLCKKR